MLDISNSFIITSEFLRVSETFFDRYGWKKGHHEI